MATVTQAPTGVRDPVSARLVTLIALTGVPARDAASLPPPAFDADAAIFGVNIRPGASEFAELTWRPRFTDLREFAAADYQAENTGSAYQVTRCRTARVVVPMAGDLLMVDLQVLADAPGLILAERDAFDPAGVIRIGDSGILTAALGGVARRSDDDVRLSALRRQILFLPAQAGRAWFGADPERLEADQARLLRQFMFKDTEIFYRPALAPVRVPPDMNGPDAQLVFVWDCNTVIAGLDAYPQLTGVRMLGVTMSNCQALGALQRCMEIRDEAVLATVWEPDAAAPEGSARQPDAALDVEARRAALEGRLRRARKLERDLNVGVEMHMLATAVAGGRPLHRYHQAVVEESPLPPTLAVTQQLLSQLAEASQVDKDLLDVAEARQSAQKQLTIAESTHGLLRQTQAFKTASLVVATIAIVLSIAGLFTSAAAVPADQGSTLLGSPERSVLFVVSALAGAVLFGAALRQASLLTLTRRWRTFVRVVRWLVSIAVLAFLALALLAVTGDQDVVDLSRAVVGCVSALLLVTWLLALENSFEEALEGTAGPPSSSATAASASATAQSVPGPRGSRDETSHV